jgi:hypothetical protein
MNAVPSLSILAGWFTIKEKRVSKMDYTSDNLSIMSSCYTCNLIGEVCPVCQDEKDAKLTAIAYEFVDDGNDKYRYAPMYTPLLKIDEPVSGHEWVGTTTRVKPYFVFATQTWEDTREEFLEPVTHLEDRPFELGDEALLKLITLGKAEKVCNACHLAFNIRLNECPVCDMVDAK